MSEVEPPSERNAQNLLDLDALVSSARKDCSSEELQCSPSAPLEGSKQRGHFRSRSATGVSMGLFDWDAKYDLHNDSMNQQHKHLLALMARLLAESEAKAPKTKQVATLDELYRWTVRHFTEEERYMESIQYSDLKTHKLIHKGLLDKLEAFARDFSSSSEQGLPPSFFNFLKLWLSSHILGIDMRYSEHSQKTRVA